ncbi:hypothetical protein GRI62_08740 [Erythrobacter arachoides]|uniref:Sulfotransferase domain-containing protein n=1 Tax=Aurantiacibacter arachoides TaxID=1850444 RepID=A0A845A2N3_9SPHN|nr:sulfotransferase domain-containing protein [Aurantiacibacter arachoides]MXO93692.1 hypothetical protein [Aurantiacibacter arachoides]GGD47385.1 sulfotransferase [Aurantiacibacter arachoides]
MAEQSPRRAEDKTPGIAWLASFPKSGNTWTRILLSNLIARESIDDDRFASLPGSISSNRTAFDVITGLPSSDLTDDEIDLLRPQFYRMQADSAEGRLYIKVHDGYHETGKGEPLFPADCSFGAIYLVRHPFDVAVSYAHHQGHRDFDKIVAQMNNVGHIMAGGRKGQLRQKTLGWGGHYRSWHQQDAIPVLTVRYEDMLADTAAALTRIAHFLGLPEAGDAQAIARAVEESRFERLRAKEEEHGFGERPEKTEKFFRSGRSGEGRDVLTLAQRTSLVASNEDVMEKLGYLP